MQCLSILHRKFLLILCVVFLLTTTGLSQSSLSEQFTTFARLGLDTPSNDEPRRLAITSSGSIFVTGTTSPLTRGSESKFGTALYEGLLDEDIFLAKVSPNTDNYTWSSSIFRLGSRGEDRVQTMLVDQDDDMVYLGGAAGAALPNTTHAGQTDLFIVKLNVRDSTPRFEWARPIMLGTLASEAITALAVDPIRRNVIYAAGYTTGGLFRAHPTEGAVQSDAILFAFSATDGSILEQRQFGSSDPNYASAIVVSTDVGGPIFVSTVTEKKYGNYKFGNFHLYKFSRSLAPLGDILLRSYSREVVTSLVKHPMLSNNLFAAGSSWLDQINGYDVFLKRIVRFFDNASLGSQELAIDDVGSNEYTRRYGSMDRRDDFSEAMIVHPKSGVLLIGGYTQGAFMSSVRTDGILAPFIMGINPMDASTRGIRQAPAITDSWEELTAVTLSADGEKVYYSLKVLNDTTTQFYTAIGMLNLPAAWKIPIEVPPSPSPTSSPSTSADIRRSPDSRFPTGVVIIGVSGGAVAAILLVIILFVWKKASDRQIGTPRFSLSPQKNKAGMSRIHRERIVPKDELVTVRHAELA